MNFICNPKAKRQKMRVEVNEDYEIIFSEVYNGIGIKTDAGTFGICQRDGGIEITKDGKLVYSKYPDSIETKKD